MKITMQNRFQITHASQMLAGLARFIVYDVQGYYRPRTAFTYQEAVNTRDALRSGRALHTEMVA